MSFRIKTNSMTLRTIREIESHHSNLTDTTTKLASGKRINKAADDAAGLAISENLRANVRSLNVAARNSLDALSVFQIAESGFMETTNMLVRIRQLAMQASSDTIGPSERRYLDGEYVALKQEIDRISAGVEFNGVRLLTGQPNPPNNSLQNLVTRAVDHPMEFQVDSHFYPGVDGPGVDNPVDIVRFSSKHLVAYTSGENSLNLGEGTNGTRIYSKGDARLSLGRINKAIEKVNEHRAALGAAQNRMTAVLQVLGQRIEDLGQAGSRIADTDFAEETANYVKYSVLKSATTSVLSSANAQPKVALSLLHPQEKSQTIIKDSIIHRSLQ